MKTLNRIAKPCGMVGGVWSILLAVLLSLVIPTRFVTTTIGGQSWGFTTSVAESWAWGVLTIIILMAIMGLLGLLAVIISKRSHRLGQIFIWVSALATLAISFVSTVTMVSVGIILFPAAILLILAAIGIGRRGRGVSKNRSR